MRHSKNLEKKDSFRHILKGSFSKHESSDRQFFRTTTRIQSRLDAFDELWLVITFLTNFRVIEILCSFKLVLGWKIGKEIPKSSRL